MGIYKSPIDAYMNVEIRTEAAQFLFWEFFPIFSTVSLQCSVLSVHAGFGAVRFSLNACFSEVRMAPLPPPHPQLIQL